MLFVQRAGGDGALAGALGAQGKEGPAGVGSLEDQTLGARGFRSVSQKCPLDGARQGAPGWAGVAAWAGEGSTEPWGGARARSGGGQGGVQARLVPSFSALVGDRGRPLSSDTTPASGDKSVWRDTLRFSPGCFISGASK